MKADAPRRFELRQIQHRLVLVCIIPLALMVILLLSVLTNFSHHYASILHNVTVASEFNRDFKSNIDLVMYYYVVGSTYSTGLPIEEVKDAQKLAQELQTTTSYPASRKAIASVLSLSRNLEEKINLVAATESYDERQRQLESNIYVLTDLIEEYMYTYLYYESVQLNLLQDEMIRRVEVETVVLTVIVALFLLLLSRYVRRMVRTLTQPIDDLHTRVQEIGQGNLLPGAVPATPVEEYRALGIGVEQMAVQMRELIEQNRLEQVHLREAELALLQAQINPHFLYNTFDTIVWLIEMNKSAEAEQMVTNLSTYFRTSLSEGRDIITLAEEESHVHSYMEIQQARYRDILAYRIDIAPELGNVRIPKLTLQPLVENSLYHGIKLKRSKGLITVVGRAEGTTAVITVSDNGVGIPPERMAQLTAALDGKERVGFGLVTVHERLRLLFGEESGLTLQSGPTGTTVTVRVPMSEMADRQEVIG